MKRTDADAAKAELIEAVTTARDMSNDMVRRTGPVYAGVVRGVIKCMDANMTRQEISSTIATAWAGGTPTQATKGIGARYIILARYQRKEWLPGERHPRSSVQVGGATYPSPLDALDGGESFTSTYEAWTAVVKARPKVQVAPRSPIIAARHMVSRMFVTVQQGDTQARLKVEEDTGAFVGVVSALMATPPAVQLIPGQTRAALARALKKVRRAA